MRISDWSSDVCSSDLSDNFDTRDAVHAACRRSGKTPVSAAIQLTSGILTTFKSHDPGENQCSRCLYPYRPNSAVIPTCSLIRCLSPAVCSMSSPIGRASVWAVVCQVGLYGVVDGQ